MSDTESTTTTETGPKKENTSENPLKEKKNPKMNADRRPLYNRRAARLR